jgi:hypothetical protein
MLNTDDLRYYTDVGTGYSQDAMMIRAADEIDRLRNYLHTIAYTGMTADQAEEHARISLAPNAIVTGASSPVDSE